MTIIAILLAFGLCHFVRELGRLRKSQWLTGWVQFANDAFGKLPGWSSFLGFLTILAVPLIVLLLVNQVLESALGNTGAFLLALAVLIYSFGPRDLDTDVAEILDAADETERDEALGTLLGEPVPEDAEICRSRTVESVFQEALRRFPFDTQAPHSRGAPHAANRSRSSSSMSLGSLTVWAISRRR